MSGTDYHRVVSMIDPTTGLARLIFGNDQGVWSVLDNQGTFETGIGSNTLTANTNPDSNRNGNLQITQFYYGAAQPSNAAAQVAGALFYGSAQDDGGPVSSPNVVTNGNIEWAGPGGDATGVGTNQQGTGTAYQYFWPCCGGADTNFFQFIGPGLAAPGTILAEHPGSCSKATGYPRLIRSGRSWVVPILLLTLSMGMTFSSVRAPQHLRHPGPRAELVRYRHSGCLQ